MEGNRPWKENLFNNSNFSQKDAYNVDRLIGHFEKTAENLDSLNPYEFLAGVYEFTKSFAALSSALSMGFSDITEKVENWREIITNFYNDDSFPNLQSVMEKEIELKIQMLNGDNNKKNGHKKGSSAYYKYTSGCRTIVRFSWFLRFLYKIFMNMLNTNDPFDKCIKSAYIDALAPHHPWLVRTSVGVALSMASSKRGPALKAFFGKK